MTDDPTTAPATKGSYASRARPAAIALVIGLAALTATASESEMVRDIQRYCTVCWRNARLDPGLWDDCTQEVCCRLLTKARVGELDLNLVLADDTPERRELVRAIDMVRKRVQRSRKYQPLDPQSTPAPDVDRRHRERQELGEILEAARAAVLSPRQDRIVELWARGWTVPEISETMGMPVARVSDEKYKALRKLENFLAGRRDELELGGSSLTTTPPPPQGESAKICSSSLVGWVSRQSRRNPPFLFELRIAPRPGGLPRLTVLALPHSSRTGAAGRECLPRAPRRSRCDRLRER
jgi:RNA polymerase sigma factor (sigma-70 family)